MEISNDHGVSYVAALLEYCDSHLHVYRGQRLMNKIFGRVMQSHAIGRAIVMHYEAQMGIGDRPTLSRLQEQIGYSRTLAAFFAVLRVAKLIKIEVDHDDRRVKYFVPSQRIIDGLRDWLEVQLRYGERFGYVAQHCSERLRNDDDYFACYLCHSRYILDNIGKDLHQFPAWKWFQEYDCGDRIAYSLLRAYYQGVLEADGNIVNMHWVKFSSNNIASELGISKSHVRNVINKAAQRVILIQNKTHNFFSLTPSFINETWAWLANNFSLFAEAARQAQESLNANHGRKQNNNFSVASSSVR